MSNRYEVQRETPPRANVGTLLAYQHAERMANAAKPGREDRPAFTAKRATTSGALGVWELGVTVPVCEEFPDSEAAFAAQVDYMQRLSAAFPLPDGHVRAK